MADDTNEINTLKDHAWRYFELHANQRISLFRYYVIFFSLFVTASGYLIVRFDKASSVEEIFVIFFSIIFIAITIIFWGLDTRNRDLIHLAEKSLRQLEREKLKSFDKKHKIFIKEKSMSICCCYRHTYCFRALFIVAILSAILLAIYSLNHMQTPKECSKNIYPVKITYSVKIEQ